MKKNEELLHSIGDIEDKYIENAKPKEIAKKNKIWISSIAAAACLMFAAALSYYFMFRPIDDINKNGNDPDKITTTTAVTKITEPPQTQQIEDKYPQVNKVDMDKINSMIGLDTSSESEIRAMSCDGESIIFQDIHRSSRDNWYLSAEIESLGKKIYLPEINNITMNDISGSYACFNDDYLYILLHGGVLYSISLNDDKIIAKQGGFHFEMDLSGSSECLGVDNDGNVYIRSSDSTEDGSRLNRIIKYSPKLIQLSEYSTANSIPFAQINNFSDMYIDSDDVLYCKYDIDKTLGINLSDETKNCDDEIINEGEYWYVKNQNGEKTLTACNHSYKNSNSMGTINYIDSVINLSVEAGKKTGYIKVDKTGGFINEYSIPDGLDPDYYGFSLKENGDIVSGFTSESEGNDSLADYNIITYNMMSGQTDRKIIQRNEYRDNGDVIYPFDFCTDETGNCYSSVVISEKIKDDESTECPLIIRYDKNNYDDQAAITLKQEDMKNFYRPEILINDNVPYVINLLESGEKSVVYKPDFDNKSYSKVSEVSGKLYPQKDGTLLCVSDGKLYSYSLESGEMTEIFNFPEGVLASDDRYSDIQKMDENSYVYISGLKFSQADQASETSMYILSVK